MTSGPVVARTLHIVSLEAGGVEGWAAWRT